MIDYKEEYIKMRDEKKYDLNFFYQYYRSKGGTITDPNDFTERFLFSVVEQQTVPGYPPIIIRTGEIDKSEVLSFLDKVFDLTILTNKEGEFLKIVK